MTETRTGFLLGGLALVALAVGSTLGQKAAQESDDYFKSDKVLALELEIGPKEMDSLRREPRKYIKDQLRTLRDVYRAAVRQMLKGQKPVSLALLERNGGQ